MAEGADREETCTDKLIYVYTHILAHAAHSQCSNIPAHGLQDSAPLTGGPKDRGQDTLLFASDQSLSYLTGELPADYGFDPLGLLDPEGKSAGFVTPSWLQYSEVIHARSACKAYKAFAPVTHCVNMLQ